MGDQGWERIVGSNTMSSLEAANNAFVDGDYEDALALYTAAIEEAATSEAYLKRATTLLKVDRAVDAVADAKKALELDPASAKAALRLGVAYFELEEFLSAK